VSTVVNVFYFGKMYLVDELRGLKAFLLFAYLVDELRGCIVAG
jgi:hypothetical protein